MKIHALFLVPAAALLGLAAPLSADPAPAPAPPDPASRAPAPSGGLAAPEAEHGQAIFRQRCGGCHAADAGKASPMGPNLAGVIGRPAGTAAFDYSATLKASGIGWTRQNLDSFLNAPMKLVPGTRMVVSVPDPAQRAAIIDYLATTKAPAAGGSGGQ